MSPVDFQIQSALEQNPYFSARHLRFENAQGRVILRGEVRSYYQKQMAQESLRGVSGVDAIENQLQVNWAGATARAL